MQLCLVVALGCFGLRLVLRVYGRRAGINGQTGLERSYGVQTLEGHAVVVLAVASHRVSSLVVIVDRPKRNSAP